MTDLLFLNKKLTLKIENEIFLIFIYYFNILFIVHKLYFFELPICFISLNYNLYVSLLINLFINKCMLTFSD